MSATGAMLTAIVIAVLLTLWASAWGVSMFLLEATVVLLGAVAATYMVSRRHRGPRH